MYKNKYKNFAMTKLSDLYVEMTSEEEEMFNKYGSDAFIIKGDTCIINPNFEQEQQEKEIQRIAMLNLTGADVERGIYKAKGMDFEDIIAYLEAQPLSEDGQAVIDIKALKIELKANNFYRGNPYVEQIGKILGFTDEQLDLFFEDGNYEHLL